MAKERERSDSGAEPKKQRRASGLPRKLLLAFGSLVVTLLVLEVFARIAPQLVANNAGLDVTELVIVPTLGSLVLLLIFCVPLLAQGGFATEHRQGRLSMWLSSPRGSVALVLGRVIGLFLCYTFNRRLMSDGRFRQCGDGYYG